ncbi:hypothetical protein [Helicobacter fennelliae]|uniref:hypothetical protein n=1 Tax=Helicobacter fennelliae TaxID=215 RepID=UPI000DD37B89|nr:hypothetical protein [Helicobacter fennelliae]
MPRILDFFWIVTILRITKSRNNDKKILDCHAKSAIYLAMTSILDLQKLTLFQSFFATMHPKI